MGNDAGAGRIGVDAVGKQLGMVNERRIHVNSDSANGTGYLRQFEIDLTPCASITAAFGFGEKTGANSVHT